MVPAAGPVRGCYTEQTMARRILYVLLAVMTLQLSWNVVTAYCMHESGRAANHFGHHEHIVSADELTSAARSEPPGKPHPLKLLAVHDAHCTSHAHVSLAGPELIALPTLAADPGGAVADTPASPTSAIPHPPERPQWTGRAWSRGRPVCVSCPDTHARAFAGARRAAAGYFSSIVFGAIMQTRHFVLGIAFLLLQAAFPAAPAMGQSSSTEATAAAPLTLDAAIALALAANPSLRAATRAIDAADGAVRQAGARPNPTLSFLSEGTDRLTRTETTQVEQLIELGGKRAARVALAARERDVAVDDAAARRAELRADVIAAYMDALGAQERLALAGSALGLARRAAEVTARRVAAGKVSPVEATRAGVAEAEAGLDLLDARADLAQARRKLGTLWASSRPIDRPLVEPPIVLEALPALEDLAARLDASPQLRRARSTVAGRDAQVAFERARRVPDLTLTLGSQREREAGRTQGVIGLSVPLPLFDRNGGNTLAALRRADGARDELEAERLRLREALADAWQRADLASTQIATLRERVLPAAQSAYQAAVTGFELGKFAYTDVLDAQRTLFQARTRYLRALADRHRSIADIERYVPAAFAAAPTPRDTIQ